MFSRFLIIFSFLFFTACEERSTVVSKGGFSFITPSEGGVLEADEIEWKVGPRRKQRVTKGVLFKIKFPLFKNNELAELTKEHDVDSWLIQIRKKSLLGSEVRGRYFSPLIVAGATPGSPFSVRQIEFLEMQLFYSAAAKSKRFENLPCPIFNHRKVLKEIDLETTLIPDQVMVVGRKNEQRILPEVMRLNESPRPIDAGASLEGDYEIEYALYNSTKKMKLSNFVNFSKILRLRKEVNRPITGCENYQIERESKEELDGFKFGK